jgi:2,5-diketo-D-gluconate reductase A
VFVTTKLNNGAHRPDDARRAFDGSLKALGSDYVDLFLIHWPLPTRYDGDFVSTWRTLEEFYADGRARSIGVSNFQPHHLRRIHTEGGITPAVDQIEVNPYLTQDEVRRFCGEHEIAVEAWSPLGRGNALRDPTIDDIARRYGKTPAQVVLRWHIERGDIVFPSPSPRRG